MKFDVIVGNPPYGQDKIGSRLLHFNIMKSTTCVFGDKLCFIMPSKCLYDVRMERERTFLKSLGCERIEIVDSEMFQETQMTDPAIYFCRKFSKDFDKKLNLNNNILQNNIEEKICFLMNKEENMYKHTVTMYGSWDKDYYNWNKTKDLKKLNKYSWFINVSYANYKENGKWIAQKSLENVGVLSLEEENKFFRTNTTTKVVLGFCNKKSAENVWNLLHTNLMRFCLWICQDDRNMKRKVWRLFPELDYSKIENERELLLSVGCDEDDINEILEYVNGFDFERKRKDRCLK